MPLHAAHLQVAQQVGASIIHPATVRIQIGTHLLQREPNSSLGILRVQIVQEKHVAD